MKAMKMTRPQNDFMDSQIGVKHDVLDYGFIKLLDYMATEDCLAQDARTSYGDGTKRVNDNVGLIKRLVRDWHTSPIEMAAIKVQVKLPIFVERQWIRHRTGKTCEYSGRYSLMNAEFYTPAPERMQKQHETNKQGSSDEVIENVDAAICGIKNANIFSKATYDALIASGLTRELARLVLPVNQYTTKTWSIDMHNLMHFIRLRHDSHAQWEIQQYANVMCELVKGWMPNLWDAFEDYRLSAMVLSGKQVKAFHEFYANQLGGYDSIELGKSLGMSKGEIRETLEKFERLVG